MLASATDSTLILEIWWLHYSIEISHQRKLRPLPLLIHCRFSLFDLQQLSSCCLPGRSRAAFIPLWFVVFAHHVYDVLNSFLRPFSANSIAVCFIDLFMTTFVYWFDVNIDCTEMSRLMSGSLFLKRAVYVCIIFRIDVRSLIACFSACYDSLKIDEALFLFPNYQSVTARSLTFRRCTSREIDCYVRWQKHMYCSPTNWQWIERLILAHTRL